MKLIIDGSAAGRALALGVAAGSWLVLSASTLAAEPLQVAGPERLYLAQAETGSAERPVSFSAEQADRGEEKFASECEECHGDDLKGGLNGGPPLRGMMFEQKYAEGAPASILFSFMSSAMPPNSPGRYSENTYTDLMAYILKKNGFSSGAPLPSDLNALDHLIMQK